MIPYTLIFRNRDIYSKRKDMCYLLQGGHMTILNINTMIILHPEYQKKHLINVCQLGVHNLLFSSRVVFLFKEDFIWEKIA